VQGPQGPGITGFIGPQGPRGPQGPNGNAPATGNGASISHAFENSPGAAADLFYGHTAADATLKWY
jgi:hypothetical protein